MDLKTPIFFDQYPSENSNLNEKPDEFTATLMDSIAGVKWSSLDGTTARVSSLADTMDIPVTYQDGVVTVNLTDIILIGPVEICFAGIEDDPSIDYCAPNVLDTCFHFSVRSRTVAEQVYPDSGIYTACTEGVLKMLLYHRYDMDNEKIELEINGDVIIGTDERISIIAGEMIVSADDTTFIDTLVFTPGAGYWQDSTWYEILLSKADDIHGSELTEPISWGFWTDFEAPSGEMIEPQDSLPIYNVHNEIVVELEDGYSGIDNLSITFTVNGTEMEVERLNWIYDRNKLQLQFEPKIFDFQYAQGDTISVVVKVCDKTDPEDYCGANCTVHEFQFFTAVLRECERYPNPFTPNGECRANQSAFNIKRFTHPALARC